MGDVVDPSARDGRSMRERMLAGELYLADDPEIEAAARRAHQLMDAFNATAADASSRRHELLTALLGALGDDTVIRAPLYIDYGSNLSIGRRCFINYGLVALDVAAITIGDDVQIATNVQLLTPTHPLGAAQRRDKWEAAAPISIGDNVWLGGGAIVCPGVSIGADTVVGAGSVVVDDLPPGVLAVGNPARVIRQLT